MSRVSPDTPDSVSPPHPLPAESPVKDRAQEGGGGLFAHGNRTVTQLLASFFLFPQGGNAVRFFHFVFSVSGPVSFAFFCRSSFLRVVFWKNFRERTFVFGWLCWSCVFWWVFAIVFALFFGVSLPKLFGKILLMSGLVFSGFVLSSLGFFRRRRFRFPFFFSRDIDQVVTGHPRTRTCFSGSFSFLCPAAFVCSARFGRASRFLAFFRGAILGPGRFWDSPWTF